MELDSSSIDSSGLGAGSEKAREVSEKQGESYKKAQAQLQKSKKDEKKAKGDNDALFNILARFIQNPYYEEFIPIITHLLSLSVPARFIISFTALIYPESAIYVLTHFERKEDIDILLNIHRYKERVDMDESTLHPSIRTWMSTWSQVTQQYLSDNEGSIILYQKLLSLMQGKEKESMIGALKKTIEFFFLSRNVAISERVAQSYAEFIFKEYIKNIKNLLTGADVELLTGTDLPLDASTLFGFSQR